MCQALLDVPLDSRRPHMRPPELQAERLQSLPGLCGSLCAFLRLYDVRTWLWQRDEAQCARQAVRGKRLELLVAGGQQR